MNTAIIVAAGSGQRFAADRPKQFISVLGKPLILHTLERFDSCPLVDEIVLVLSEAGREEFAQINGITLISKLKHLVTGGATRAASVRNGIDVIEPTRANIVAVHDGARPLVTVDEITRTLSKAEESGAACLVAEVNDTIKEVEGEHIVRTIDRSSLRRALTPQAFRYDILKSAFEGVDLSESVTDECYLVERAGVSISIVEGSARNIKVTRPEDIVLAEGLLREESL